MIISVVTPSVGIWYIGLLYVLQLTVSVFQSNINVSSTPLWRSHMTASSRSTLRTSGVSHPFVCRCLFVSNSNTSFNISFRLLMFTDTPLGPSYSLEGDSSMLEILIYFWLIPIQLCPPPAPKYTNKFKKYFFSSCVAWNLISCGKLEEYRFVHCWPCSESAVMFVHCWPCSDSAVMFVHCWPCSDTAGMFRTQLFYTFSNYQLNAQFLYSSAICMIHYDPQHVSSSTLLILRRTNCITTASGIVTQTAIQYAGVYLGQGRIGSCLGQ